MYKLISLALSIVFICSCVENTIYSGKILNQDNFSDINFNNKKELIKNFGNPSYIDPIEKKYFYFIEKKEKKSIFNKKVAYSYVFVFQFDEKNIIKNSRAYDLSKQDSLELVKEITENEIVKRGLIEKVFGGVGPQQELPQ